MKKLTAIITASILSVTLFAFTAPSANAAPKGSLGTTTSKKYTQKDMNHCTTAVMYAEQIINGKDKSKSTLRAYNKAVRNCEKVNGGF